MKSFHRFFTAAAGIILLIFAAANFCLLQGERIEAGRPYRVEINRMAREIAESGPEGVDCSGCEYITKITGSDEGEAFFDTDSDYSIREINGIYYRFDYTVREKERTRSLLVYMNGMIAVMALFVFIVLWYVRKKILLPFQKMTDVPYELSRGNLTVPIKESGSRYFGKFAWGVDLLRETIERQKERELSLQKKQKTMVLSISHDIKTPLSAIKLYARALSKGLYAEKEKQLETAEHIYAKADEIERFAAELIRMSNEDFLSLPVTVSEFYLSKLTQEITEYYEEKLFINKTDFSVADFPDYLIKGDFDRSVEVLQNIMENALKYGDGHAVCLYFSEEEDCVLISVSNSGCTLSENELPHIFDSFWRGANADGKSGSGLGLYICRELMHKMGGEIFAEATGGVTTVTAVFGKA